MDAAGNNTNENWYRVPLAAILLFEFSALIARSYFEVRLRVKGLDLDVAADLSYLVVPPILLILMYPVLKKHGHLLLTLFRPGDLTLRIVVIGVSLGIVLRLASWAKTIALSAPTGLPDTSTITLLGMQGNWSCPILLHMLLGVFVGGFLIPIIEECINRGYLLFRFKSRGKLFAVIASSFFFAIFHEPQTILPAFAVGIVFAIATMNSGALWLSTIAHATHNLSVEIEGSCLTVFWSPLPASNSVVSIAGIATMLSITCFIGAICLTSRRVIGALSPPQ